MKMFTRLAKWIGAPDAVLTNWQGKVLPSPFFRKSFVHRAGKRVIVRLCGLGFSELHLNGRKVGDGVLDPVATHYDKRIRFISYDVSGLLVPGVNVLGVILGNGWYNCHTPEVWHFDKASWRAYPKMLLQLEVDGKAALASDTSWNCATGPIVFDGLRNGETYDARLELGDWLSPNYDDSNWKAAWLVEPPGGVLEEQTMPSCKVTKTVPVAKQWTLPSGATVHDFGQNLAGWVRLKVSGERGAELTISHGERLNADGSLDQTSIAQHVKVQPGEFQTDRYILKGGGVETWEPRFTYHGFQYTQIASRGKLETLAVEARVVHTAFASSGSFTCSNTTLNQLQECTRRAYLGNFVGIPTDCPHREKNGWTGDAQLAAETGLFNFSASSSYAHWLVSLEDAQRTSGQLPGIVPSCGWGYHGCGPAWDSALFLIPWQIYLFTGDSSPILRHYKAMARYLDYCAGMATGHLLLGHLPAGLGDWCHVDKARMVDPALTSTAYYYADALLMAKFAALSGRGYDMRRYARLAESIKQAFNAKFHRGDGLYAKGEQTAQACALQLGLVEEAEKAAAVKRLVAAVEATGRRPDFGILGAKFVPRALVEHGHADMAFELITQPEFPGWAHWLSQGATTLWENWEGTSSRNHIMFGDISAWMYQYLAGIAPDPEQPGFKHFFVRPCFVAGLDWVEAEHLSPQGKFAVAWRRAADGVALEVEIPVGSTATVGLPGGDVREMASGKHKFQQRGHSS